MFQALKQLVKSQPRPCSSCGTLTELLLNFNFALGVQTRETASRAGYLPRHSLPTWQENDSNVTFYPFLIIVENKSEAWGEAAWLPYFHLIDGSKSKPVIKYGQWAPYLGIELFSDLLAQAMNDGHLKLP